MTENWARLEEVFHRALECAPDDLASLLAEECAGEPELQEEVVAMLRAASPEARLEIEDRLLESDECGEHADEADGPSPPSRLGSYQLIRLIGRGGMGEVYLAERDDDYRQQVAVKLVAVGYGAREIVARFRAERQILARLTHPNIAQLLDGGTTDDGRPYLVMQYIDGQPVTEYCDRSTLTVEDRLRIFVTVCSAVQFAHQNLVVHRDLKPSNILVTETGEVKLLDFGIAKLLDPGDELATMTHSELRLMSPEHAAPEQVRGEAVSTATDVYGLGVLLYELLSGRLPFPRGEKSRSEFERELCEEEPASSSSSPDPAAAARRRLPAGRLKRRLEGDLDTIVAKALRKEPERRYGSVLQLAEDVERHLKGLPVQARPETLVYKLGKFASRNVWATAASAILVLLAASFVAVTWHQARAVARERDAAEQVTDVLVELFDAANPSKMPQGRTMAVGELLDLHAKRTVDQLEGQPAVQARIRHVLGNVYYSLSRYAQARPLLDAALNQQVDLSGREAPATLTIRHDLALLTAAENPERGVPQLRDSLARQRRVFGAADERVVQAMQDLAASLPAGDSEALELRTEALDLRRRLTSEPDETVAFALHALAISHHEASEHQEAEQLYREALDILRSVKTQDYPLTNTVMNDWAALLVSMGRYDEAAVLNRQALESRRQVFGSESWQVAESLNNMAILSFHEGDRAEAEKALREVRALWSRLVGPDHPQTGNTTRNLGLLLALDGQYEEALPLLQQAAETGHGELQVAHMDAQVAVVLRRLGRLEEAVATLEDAVARLRREKPGGHRLVASAEASLGEAYLESGLPQKAEQMFRTALAYRESVFSADHPTVAEASCGLGRALAWQGDWEEAVTALERGLPGYSAWEEAHPDEVAAARSALEKARRSLGS